jgi:hypothetical protein
LHSQFLASTGLTLQMTKVPNPLRNNDLRECGCGLKPIPKYNGQLRPHSGSFYCGVPVRRGSIRTNSAALLMCSPEWREPHSRMKRIDFLKQRCIECTVLNVGQSCF